MKNASSDRIVEVKWQFTLEVFLHFIMSKKYTKYDIA